MDLSCDVVSKGKYSGQKICGSRIFYLNHKTPVINVHRALQNVDNKIVTIKYPKTLITLIDFFLILILI